MGVHRADGGRRELRDVWHACLAPGSNGTRACNYILQTAAQPVLTRMLHNASIPRRSGTLSNSIRIGRVVKKRSGGYRVTVGVHRADGGAEYASPVEFGHGGPHPAPPHPFIRPPSTAAWTKPTKKPNNCLDRPSTHDAANTAKEEFPPCLARPPRPPYRLRWA